MKNTFLLGCFYVAMANMFIGVNIIITKYLVNALPVSVLLELRYCFGALILFIPILLSKNKFSFYQSNKKYTSKQKFIYLNMALCSGVLFNAIFIFGMKNTTAIATGVIGSTLPLLVVAFSAVFLNQRIQIHHFICAFLVAIGIFIITLGNTKNSAMTSMFQNSQISNLIVFIAMIPEAMFTIFAKMLPQKVSPVVSAFLINILNLAFCTPFFIYTLFHFSIFSITPLQFSLCALIGLFSGVLFYVFYNAGISRINAQTAGLLCGVVPISTTILAIFILHESFGWISFIGMLFVLFSIYLGVHKAPDKKLGR